MDSGIGLLPAAAAVRRLRPDADLLLSNDPDGMPWGPRTPEDLTARALAVALAAAEHRPAALIVACNTATVHALPAIRAALEPDIPVIGTVPAIKPAAAAGGKVAIWATPATTGSAYQRGLIRDFAGGAEVTEVPCPGLADAVEHADPEAVDRAVAAAAALTPGDVRTVVLGCTHYELVEDRILAALEARGRATCPARLLRIRRRRRRPGAPPRRRRARPRRGPHRHPLRAAQRAPRPDPRHRPRLRRRPAPRRGRARSLSPEAPGAA